MRARTWAPLVLLAPLLSLTSVLPADAAVLCQGKEATIVGVGTQEVTGTDGDDVIVAAGRIDARGGDDTICTGGPRVLAGDGDDSVTTDGSTMDRFVELGDGDDTYVGGPGRDEVGYFLAFGYEEPGVYDGGDDTVSTGAGDDTVRVGALGSAPQADRVDLGPGDDEVDVLGEGLTAAGAIEGGPGRDHMSVVTRAEGAVVLDLPDRTLTLAGRAFVPRWTSLEDFAVWSFVFRDVRVVGTPGPDTVRIARALRLDATMGGGDDLLRLQGPTGPTGRADGGPGRDRIAVAFPRPTVDLAEGYVRSRATPRQRLRLRSFADVSAAPRAVVVGDAGPNRIDVGCGRVFAGRGDDVVRQTALTAYGVVGPLPERPSTCRELLVRGGPGRDRIRGSLSRDDLDGGPGRDRVDGLAGRDRCVAERRIRCER